ncbi:MAG TPA: aminoacyl--tRNA ligase-related protein, partial [Nitrososphaera sp.]|nr:aminoacyl--tRNA ligase-related protein [Nitrososphaera sp.]
MIDPRLLKENPQWVRDMLSRRNMTDFPIDELVTLDKRRRELIVETQELRQKKNVLAEAIARKKKGKQDAAAELAQMKEASSYLGDSEEELVKTEGRFKQLMMVVPNMLHESVPAGRDEKDNKVLRQNGNTKKLDFAPKDHVDIAAALDLVDIERAAKMSGARFYFLKNELVKMNQALVNFALDFLSKHGYTPVQPPYMIRKEPMSGAVILGDFQDVIYKIEGEDLYMIGTSEHAIAGMHMDEILDGKKLPMRYAGYSPCFRKEAGAHGKDMK